MLIRSTTEMAEKKDSIRNSEAFRKMLSEAGRKGGKRGSHEDKVRAGKLGYQVWKQNVAAETVPKES
jgi:hypothetical protein